MKPYWQGVFPAVTTQLKKDQSLDLDATARHIEALIESGVTGLIMLGSLGDPARWVIQYVLYCYCLFIDYNQYAVK